MVEETTTLVFHAFMGAVGDVSRGLFGLPRDIVERTWFVLLLQGRTRADIRIFEREAGAGEGTVSMCGGERTWAGGDHGR